MNQRSEIRYRSRIQGWRVNLGFGLTAEFRLTGMYPRVTPSKTLPSAKIDKQALSCHGRAHLKRARRRDRIGFRHLLNLLSPFSHPFLNPFQKSDLYLVQFRHLSCEGYFSSFPSKCSFIFQIVFLPTVPSSFDLSKLFPHDIYYQRERGHKAHQRRARHPTPHRGWRISPIFMVCLIYSFIRSWKKHRGPSFSCTQGLFVASVISTYYACVNKDSLAIAK